MSNTDRMPRHKVWRILGPLLLLTLGASAAREPAESPEERQSKLRGTGPYRGQVVHAVTKQPLAGAVVVAVWYDSTPTPAGDITHFHDAVEVLTDAQGFFTVDAPGIERRAPRRTRWPVFTIFKPGYLYSQGWLAEPEVLAERKSKNLLAVVELEPIAGKGRRARLRNLSGPPTDVPADKVPQLIKAIREEDREIQKEQLP